MYKPALIVLASAALAACGTFTEGTLIDFGPEPGTPGDEAFWHYQPELHGPQAQARDAAGAGPAATTTGPDAATPPPEPATVIPTLPPPPPEAAPPPAPTSEALFNDAIRRAVEAGDIDRALRLLEEAERLGSRSARPTFIEAVSRPTQ